MVGGALAVSGTAFQGIFKNPLVSSGILGVSAGAGFGATLAILLFNSMAATYPLALGFGMLAVMLSVRFFWRNRYKNYTAFTRK